MTIANASQRSASSLPQGMRTAQKAIRLPEVQEMLRRLAEYNLGIFMPHMHDERTGELQPLSGELVQVEAGLAVSFLPTNEVANSSDRFLPVGWSWRAGAPTPSAVCEMVWEEGQDDAERSTKHKMK